MTTPQGKANHSSTAIHNRRLTIQLLREYGQLSRRQLGELTGLRSSTLTYIMRDLLEHEVVRTVGKRASKSVGKKQVLLEINPHVGWSVGIGVETEALLAVVMDAAGNVTLKDRIPCDTREDRLEDRMADLVQSLCNEDRPIDRLLGVGLGVPGVVNPDEGLVLQSTMLKRKMFPIGKMLAAKLDAPVHVDNDVNCAAIAEARDGHGTDLNSFVFFIINAIESGDRFALTGVGSALYLAGKMYRGQHFASGEIDALLDNDPLEAVTASQLLQLADAKAPLTPELETIAARLARTMSIVVDLLDPQALIIGGNVDLANQVVIERIAESINTGIIPIKGRDIVVRGSRYTTHGVPVGASCRVLDAVMLGVGHQMPSDRLFMPR
ncbi:ROK family protein [Mucisphaera sp.]|uniref:ROK family protein n=1 Tax=Mucisphaera sp. TaxID=2913024 RepID=UPI003D0ACEE1